MSALRRLALVLVIAVAACGAHTELRSGVYHTEHTSYRLGSLGANWQRHDSDADLAFYDAELDAMIMINSECPPSHDAPLNVAANTLLLGFTDREPLSEERVSLAGRDALHRRLRAKLDGAPLTLDLYVVKKDDCLYDLVYLAPADSVARGAADFSRFVEGFDTVEGERLAGRATERR